MATRGTALLLMDSQVLMSTEFNGDMYESGHGDSFFENLSKVQNEDDFDIFLNKFNEKNFGYEEALLNRCNNEDIYEEFSMDKNLEIDFKKDYSTKFFSDWIFIKNITGQTVKFKQNDYGDNEENEDITLKHGDTARFYFGKIKTEPRLLLPI